MPRIYTRFALTVSWPFLARLRALPKPLPRPRNTAHRQWPGNGADINFRGVVDRSRALLVAAAPQLKVSERYMSFKEQRDAYLASSAYAVAQNRLPFCRLWCIVEIFSAACCGKPIVFRVCTAESGGAEEGARAIVTRGGFYTLLNFSNMVDLAQAACAVAEDRAREMAAIRRFRPPAEEPGDSAALEARGGDDADPGGSGVAFLERVVRARLAAGSIAVKLAVSEVCAVPTARKRINIHPPCSPSSPYPVHGRCWQKVDAFACGEPEALRALPPARATAALSAACAAGDCAAVACLLDGAAGAVVGPLARLWEPLWLAAANNHAPLASLLLDRGSLVDACDPKMGRSPLWKAALNGHARAVRLLLAHGADPRKAKRTDGSRFERARARPAGEWRCCSPVGFRVPRNSLPRGASGIGWLASPLHPRALQPALLTFPSISSSLLSAHCSWRRSSATRPSSRSCSPPSPKARLPKTRLPETRLPETRLWSSKSTRPARATAPRRCSPRARAATRRRRRFTSTPARTPTAKWPRGARRPRWPRRPLAATAALSTFSYYGEH